MQDVNVKFFRPVPQSKLTFFVSPNLMPKIVFLLDDIDICEKDVLQCLWIGVKIGKEESPMAHVCTSNNANDYTGRSFALQIG